jgi:hypothetical protein
MMVETEIDENDPLYAYLKTSPMATSAHQTFELTIADHQSPLDECGAANVKGKIAEWEAKRMEVQVMLITFSSIMNPRLISQV